MPADRELRRARDRFGSEKTQIALNEAILSIRGVTIFDSERILEQLFKRLTDFKSIGNVKAFREAVVAWATRQARLTVKLREILRELHVHGHVATMLFLRLPQFADTDAEFRTWVQSTVEREQEGIEALAHWIVAHKRAVRAGIWAVLSECTDLDLGEFSNENDETKFAVLDELEAKVWRKIAYSTDQILSSSEPIRRQFWWKGYWAATAWKSHRIDEKKKHAGEKYAIGLNGLEKIIADDNGDDEVEVSEDEVKNFNAELNPIIIGRLPWTKTDFDREVRRVLRMNHTGPFRPDEEYDQDGQIVGTLAAA